MSDASMQDGHPFVLGPRRRRGLLGMIDDAPRIVGESMERRHLEARRSWRQGRTGRQVSWSHHGAVRIIRFEEGDEVAAWVDETFPSDRRTKR